MMNSILMNNAEIKIHQGVQQDEHGRYYRIEENLDTGSSIIQFVPEIRSESPALEPIIRTSCSALTRDESSDAWKEYNEKTKAKIRAGHLFCANDPFNSLAIFAQGAEA